MRLIVCGAAEIAKWFLPIVGLILFGAIPASRLGNGEGYIRITGGLYWGAMLMIYGLSYSLFLFDVDAEPRNPSSGRPAGFCFWFC